MTAQTPGQAFRDTLRERWVARGRCVDIRDYADLPREDREDLEAAAQAAIDSFLAGDSVSAESIRGALAARERPVPTRAELETAMAAAIQDLIDEDAAREPQPAPGLSEPVTVAGVPCGDWPSLVAALQAEVDRERAERLHLAGERDETRSDLRRMHRMVLDVLATFPGESAKARRWRDQAGAIIGRHSQPQAAPLASQSQADYERRMEALFTPVKREVQRLRTALDDAGNLSEEDL